MAVYTPTLDQSQLNQLNDDVAELIRPFSRPITREHVYWDRNRNRKVQTYITTHWYPPLIDQLRAALHPGGMVKGPEKRKIPDSKTPLSVDPMDRLILIEAELKWWCRRLEAGPVDGWPGDWVKASLRKLASVAPKTAAHLAEELIRDVRKWYVWAARQAGWDTIELLDLRKA